MATISDVLTITNSVSLLTVVNGSYMVQNTITINEIAGVGMSSTNANSTSTITSSITLPRPNGSTFIGAVTPFGNNKIVGRWS